MLSGLMGECAAEEACTTEDGEPIERSIELPNELRDSVSIFGLQIPVWLIVAGVGLALFAGSGKGK